MKAIKALNTFFLKIVEKTSKHFNQNMPVAGAARVVRGMAETTELNVKTDDTELALF